MARHRDTTEDIQHKAEALQKAEDQRQEAEEASGGKQVLLKAQVETPDPRPMSGDAQSQD